MGKPIRFAVLALALLLAVGTRAFGHDFSMVSIVSLKAPDQVTVKLEDLAFRPVEGAALTATVTPDGAKPRPLPLKEGPAGTFTGKLPAGSGGRVGLSLEATVSGDRFESYVELDTTRDNPDTTRPMQPAKTSGPAPARAAAPSPASWQGLALAAAAALLAATAGVALLRRAKKKQR